MLKLINIQPQNLDLHTPQMWRSWLNDLTHWQHDLLHNHKSEGGEIYRYPLVQYHAHGFCGINAGANLLLQLLPLLEAETSIYFQSKQEEIRLLESFKTFEVRRWQPFNSQNYTHWNATQGLVERVQFLESILIGNLLGFSKAVGFEIPNKSLQVKIIGNLEDLGFQRFSTLNAELHRRTFHVQFETNLAIPIGIGLGRGASKGFGQVGLVKTGKYYQKNRYHKARQS